MSYELTITKLKGNGLDDKVRCKFQVSQTLNHYGKSKPSEEYCYATSPHLRKDLEEPEVGRSVGKSTYMICLFLQDDDFRMLEIS